MKKIIGIISLKGGVGKTTSVISLGSALSEFDKKVLLIDGNLSSPTLGLHLNLINPDITLHHVLEDKVHIKDAIYQYDKLHLIPSSIFHKSNVNPLKLKNKIYPLKKNYDVIIIDSSPSLNEETLSVMLASDSLVVVTTPDHATLAPTLKAIKLAKQRGTKISGIIINKVHDKKFEIPPQKIEETLGVPVLAVIPYDKHFLKALSKRIPYTYHKPNSRASKEYKKLAATLIGGKYMTFDLRDFLRLTPRIEEINRELYYKGFFD
ncbi:MAG: septum site-determining protein MinD [Candidatus Pacearchaeota archaeon]|nr:MAG: septum site-determining protein MinD [Candidatus Pacearchaeota archaeon]